MEYWSIRSFQFLARSQGEKEAVRASRECPHLRIEIWGTQFCVNLHYLPNFWRPCIWDIRRCWALMPPPEPMDLNILRIWAYWRRRLLTSWTVVPEPRAMRLRRLPLMISWSARSLAVIELMMDSTRVNWTLS